MPAGLDHHQTKELEQNNRILEANPTINELAIQDLFIERIKNKAGAKGMTADQVVRCAVIKQMFEFSYEDLAFHIVD